jgi:hypothetical protein
MTRPEFEFFLLCSAILCLVLAIFNVARPRSRRYFLSAAFLAVGGGIILVRQSADVGGVVAAGALAFVLLVVDFSLRARNQVLSGEKK